MHTDDEDEREQDGSDDLGELPQCQHTDQNPGPAEHDDQPTRYGPRSRAAVLGSVMPGTVSRGHPHRPHRLK
jgi:hypothetical protein